MRRQIYLPGFVPIHRFDVRHAPKPATMGNLPPRAESREDEYALRGNDGSGQTDASGPAFSQNLYD